MTLREAFAQARQGAATGWLVVHWQKDRACTLDDQVRFMRLRRNAATQQPGRPPKRGTPEWPSLPPELVAAEWQLLCSSRGFRAVVRETDKRSGSKDDAACLVAVLWYSLFESLTKDGEVLAADLAVSSRRSHAHAYLSRSGRGTIFAALAVGKDGNQYECASVVLLRPTAGAASVGQAVLEVLSRYCAKSSTPRAQKKTQWPSFRSSGHKSLRAFEQDVVPVSLERDEQRLTMLRRDQEGGAAEMIHLPATCPVEEIGRRLMQLARRVAAKTKAGAARCEAAPERAPNTRKSRRKCQRSR